MNLLLLDDDELDDAGRVKLAGRRAEHLLGVLRVTPGKTLRAGVVGGALGQATVLAVDPATVTLELRLGEPQPVPPPVDLILALPRPQMLHRILQHATAMGVRRLDLVKTWRVEKSFFGSPSLRPEAIDRQLRLGAEQGMTTRLPEVAIHHRLLPFLTLWSERGGPPLRLIAELDAAAIEDAWPTGATAGGSVVAIGPEGGWIEREIDSFQDLGFVPVALGPWVLRVEAAVVAALSQMALLRRLRAC